MAAPLCPILVRMPRKTTVAAMRMTRHAGRRASAVAWSLWASALRSTISVPGALCARWCRSERRLWQCVRTRDQARLCLWWEPLCGAAQPAALAGPYHCSFRRRACDPGVSDGSRKYIGQPCIPEANMKQTVARLVYEAAPHGSCGDRISVSVCHIDVYLLPDWHKDQSLSLLQPGADDYRIVGRLRMRTRAKTYRSRSHHIGCCGLLFNADPRVHVALFYRQTWKPSGSLSVWAVRSVVRSILDVVRMSPVTWVRRLSLTAVRSSERDIMEPHSCGLQMKFFPRFAFVRVPSEKRCIRPRTLVADEVWDVDYTDLRTWHYACPEYLRRMDLGQAVPYATLFSFSILLRFVMGRLCTFGGSLLLIDIQFVRLCSPSFTRSFSQPRVRVLRGPAIRACRKGRQLGCSRPVSCRLREQNSTIGLDDLLACSM